MAEDRLFKSGVDDVAKYENKNLRDSCSPEHGTGNPHLQPGELQDSAAWKAHKSGPSPATEKQKSQGPAEPPKKSA